jgi:hypothetical protein
MAGTPDYTGSPFSGLYSFFANAPATSPLSAQGLEGRRRIAAALAAANAKKGYPKNIGEGIASIGEALGERRTMSELAAQEAAYQKAVEDAAAGAAPAEAKPAPARTSAVEPSVDTASEDTTPRPTTVAQAPDAPPRIVAASEPADDGEGDPWQARSQAIAGIESGGARDPYTSVGAATRTGDRAIGKYQVMSANVPGWTQAALGQAMTPEQFRASPDAQEAVFRHRFGSYVDKYGEEGAARAWFAGEKGMNNPNATDVHGRLTVADYGKDYLNRLGGGGPRDRAAVVLAARDGPPDAQDARLSEVVGMGRGPTGGFSYPPTAARSDISSDAPPIGVSALTGGPGPGIGGGVIDTVQQRQLPPVQAVPQPNPTLAGSTAPTTGGLQPNIRVAQAAGRNPPIVTDAITPAPGIPPGLPAPNAPLTGFNPRQVPIQQPDPQDVGMTDDEKRGWALRSKAIGLGSKELLDQANELIKYGQQQRTYMRGADERELARQKSELEVRKGKQFGGLSEEAVMAPVITSAKAVAGIPAANVAIRNAARLVPDMAPGVGAEVDTSIGKLLHAAGFPLNPAIPAREQFKAFIMPALAAARQAQSGGANISDNDMLLASKAVAGDIKLEKESIQAILDELQRVNVKAAGGDDPMRHAYLQRAYGLPMQEILDPDALQYLRDHPTADVVKQFNSKYHTPGLAQQILGGG